MELLLKLTPAITSILFALGGTGYKWARRYVLPVVAFLLLNTTFNWLPSLVTSALMCIGFTLPYGSSLPDKFKWIIRLLVVSTWFLPVLLTTGGQLVNVVVAVSCTLLVTLMFWISNQKWGERWLTWWIWEPVSGFLAGINLTMARL